MDPKTLIATPADLDALTSFDFSIDVVRGVSIVLKCRRVDVLTLVLEDALPSTLYHAALIAFEKARDGARTQNKSLEGAFDELEVADKQHIRELLQRYACAIVIEPKLVLPINDRSIGANEFDVRRIDLRALLALWNYSPPAAVIPRLAGADAAAFHSPESDAVAAAAQSGDDVSPGAVDVDPQPSATRHAGRADLRT